MTETFVFSELEGYRPLSLDLHRPEQDGAPLVVFLHGGGWRMGSRQVFCPTMTADEPFRRFTDRGLAIASVDYRLSREATFPAQVHDVTAAIEWLRANADELGIDGARIVLWGESAGATLAALVGLQPVTHVVGVVDWYGPSDLLAMAAELGQLDDPDTREAGWIGAPLSSAPELARAASPVEAVHSGAPPFVIAHGTDDHAVPPSQSRLLASALQAAGVPVELTMVPGAGHVWQGDVDRLALLEQGLAFVERVTAR